MPRPSSWLTFYNVSNIAWASDRRGNGGECHFLSCSINVLRLVLRWSFKLPMRGQVSRVVKWRYFLWKLRMDVDRACPLCSCDERRHYVPKRQWDIGAVLGVNDQLNNIFLFLSRKIRTLYETAHWASWENGSKNNLSKCFMNIVNGVYRRLLS